MKLTQYSTNNNNKKDISYTDLKNGLTNMKVKSTNFSSNISYDSYDKNENININTNLYSNFHSKKDKDKHNLHKVTFINLNPNNKIKKSKLYDNTLIDNKIKSNTNVENRKHKIPKLKSTILLSKTLKTIDEYMELKKNKKYSHSKKKEKRHNMSNIKVNINQSNKKEKNKSKNKEKNKLLKKVNKNNLNLRNE